MDNQKCIDVLISLKDYVNENWDEEYRQDIDDANDAVDMAVKIISSSSACGTLEINGKKYIVSAVD